MNFLGYFLGLLTISSVIFAFYTLYRDYYGRNYSTQAVSGQNPAHPILPYLSEKARFPQRQNGGAVSQFEQHIFQKFDSRYFHCIQRKSTEAANDTDPLSNTEPDFYFEYRHKFKKISFAVEFKWQSAFVDDAIRWADTKQIQSYHSYQYKNQVPVFIILGIGGTAGDPEELYVVPLHKISRHQGFLTTRFLSPYKKNLVTNNFFLDTTTMILK